MPSLKRRRLAAIGLLASIVIAPAVLPLHAQNLPDDFVTGDAALAWERWNNAMQAILDQDQATAEFLFGDLLRMDVAPLRVALLARYSQEQNINAGGVLLFEQDGEAGALGENGQQIYARWQEGVELYNQANDGFFFSVVGRFDVAEANFRALLDSNPDPVAMLEFVDQVPQRARVLVQLADHPEMGPIIREIVDLLQEGEDRIKADPIRIQQQIERLAGPPRGFENAVAALKDSGEYAVPFLLEVLRDADRRELTQPVVRALPLIDRPALNPLVQALEIQNQDVRLYVIRALGEIGYWQAVPYLLELRQAEGVSQEIKNAIDRALTAISDRGQRIDPNLTAAEAFYRLANAYYADQSSLAADPTLEQANVWYWRDGILQNVPVPTPIFNEVMAMRCARRALQLNPQLRPPVALWIAANFRREAQLEADQTDPTRPENFPGAFYFAESAGPDYCLMALDRAVRGGDTAVALGTIDALRRTAGSASILADSGQRLPLAEALAFPNQMVRIRAALALANANPRERFNGYQNLMPVLSEALLLSGGAQHALVVDPTSDSANAAAASLRVLGYEVLTDSSLYNGLQKAREELPGVDVILLASDVREPDLEAALRTLRGEFRFSSVPVVVLAKTGDLDRAEAAAAGDPTTSVVVGAPAPERLERLLPQLFKAAGIEPITGEVGVSLALQAAGVLQLLAQTNNPVFSVADVQDALLLALDAEDAFLRRSVADVLAFVPTPRAQAAIAERALSDAQQTDLRIAMFAALADAARYNGNLLASAPGGADLIDRTITLAKQAENMDLRAAAAEAMGALNLPSDPASEIIRGLYTDE